MIETDAERVDRYLQTPEKKRREYIVLAFGERFDTDISRTLETHIKKSYQIFAVAKPKGKKEFMRFLNRKVQLIIIEDRFLGIEENIHLIKLMKQKMSITFDQIEQQKMQN